MYDGHKISRFVRTVPIDWKGESVVAIYHNMNGGFMLVSREMWDAALRDVRENPPLLNALLGQKVLIPDSVDESIVFAARRQEIIHNYNQISSHVLITRRCNLGCVYCIVDAEAETMDSETARKIDDFYLRFIKRGKPDQVIDMFSGGEVMLNPRLAVEIATRRYEFCTDAGIEYKFGVITNGTLVKPAVVEAMNKVGFTGLRVSIAGPEDIHNRLRPFRGGGDSYATIMENLRAVSGMTPIKVQTQYDPESEEYLRVPDMMDDMAGRGIAVEDVSFTPILPRRGSNQCQCGPLDSRALMYLKQEADKRGFPQFDRTPGNGCRVDRKSGLTFDTDGSIISCPAFQSGEMKIGHVSTGIDFVVHSQIMHRRFEEECLKECGLAPICDGGCRMNCLAGGKSFNDVDCHKEFLAVMLDEYIRRKALKALRANEQQQRN